MGFRFLYVGAHDVQWDNAYGLGLTYMHARHYSPFTGRFLQPDPARAEPNLYGYAGDSPVAFVDPTGLSYLRRTWVRARIRYQGTTYIRWRYVTLVSRRPFCPPYGKTYHNAEGCTLLTYATIVATYYLSWYGVTGGVAMILATPVDAGLTFVPGLLVFSGSVGMIGLNTGDLFSCVFQGRAAY